MFVGSLKQYIPQIELFQQPFDAKKALYIGISILSLGIVPLVYTGMDYLLHRAFVHCILPAMRRHSVVPIPDAVKMELYKPVGKLALEILTREVNQEDARWIIYCNSVSDRFQDSYSRITQIGEANLLMFNYRGVSKSEGFAWKFQDLVDDCRSAIQYLRGRKPNARIKVIGHSMGGAVAVCAGLKKDIQVAAFNTYSSLPAVLDAYIDEANGPLAFLEKAILRCGKDLINRYGWADNIAENFKNLQKTSLIVSNDPDEIIPESASLHYAVKENRNHQHLINYFDEEGSHALHWDEKIRDNILDVASTSRGSLRDSINQFFAPSWLLPSPEGKTPNLAEEPWYLG